MRMYDLILKKRNGQELSTEEINFFVQGYQQGKIPDYQAAALLMAIYFRKMNKRETADLTMAMVHSGEILDLKEIEGIKIDKHSTGGVGDKVSLVLAPLVAAAGVKIAKMSGRGLGHTGGTIDKLEAIPGFRTDLSQEEFIHNVNTIGLAITGQTADLAPADKKLYALRDTTATVDNLSLIAASIMSKKIASGADKILLDVKTGSGAFMKTTEEARALAQEMVDIGARVGKETVAVISDMDQPLGWAVGNALEVEEAIATLQGQGPEDLYQLCLELGAQMLLLAQKTTGREEAIEFLEKLVAEGKALAKFQEFIQAQGGTGAVIENPKAYLPQATQQLPLKAPQGGYISKIDAQQVGLATLSLGAGRETKESSIDLAVGIVLHKKVGQRVQENEPLATIYGNYGKKIHDAAEKLREAFSITDSPPQKRPLIIDIIASN